MVRLLARFVVVYLPDDLMQVIHSTKKYAARNGLPWRALLGDRFCFVQK